MTCKDMIVIIDSAADAKFRAEAACALARRSGAHLSGLFLRSDFLRGYFAEDGLGYLPPASFDTLLADHERLTQERVEAARALFEAAAADAGIASDWTVINGDDNQPVIERARRVDLTVMPPRVLAALGTHRVTAAAVGMACGGPVIVLPETAPPPGEKILVAWKKGSRESARALRDAWPLIEAAREVHVLTIARDGDDEADDDLQRHFERHGLRANLILERQSQDQASVKIRNHVTALGADLLVMGLFGRPRLEELVLGGVSDVLLHNPPCALFVSH